MGKTLVEIMEKYDLSEDQDGNFCRFDVRCSRFDARVSYISNDAERSGGQADLQLEPTSFSSAQETSSNRSCHSVANAFDCILIVSGEGK